ncbi:MAG: DEAD/DEAH box helicase, partial [Burkholderiales bacterium]
MTQANTDMYIIRVALDVPVAKLFDYRAPAATAADVGRRVLVPFGRKNTVGVIVELAQSTLVPAERLKEAVRILRDLPPLAAEDLHLLRFAADYYHHPLGAVVMGALPTRLRRLGDSPRPKGRGSYLLTAAGTAVKEAALPPRASAQRRLLARLRQGPLGHAEAGTAFRQGGSILKRFLERGWVKLQEDEHTDMPVPFEAAAAPELTAEQARAVSEIRARLGGFHPFLLLGVTSSGKTEVYLHAIAATLEAGQQALVLVPEIALTPQLEALVQHRFPGTHTVSLHSGLAEAERLEHWRAACSGRARIVLGTRLAVFAPLRELGLIVVDEEQDSSFKLGEGFRYSARDLAVVRARQRGVPVVLASATPALETYHNA